MHEIKKIVAIGPESTGKSTLCQSLANHYNSLWCPEYARAYLLGHGTGYTFDDLLTVTKGQLKLEKEYVAKAVLAKNPFLFIDTDMYVMKIWCEYVFQKCHLFILDQIINQQVDLYLLCNTDLPWVKDELREYPDKKAREELYHLYKDILINQQVPWIEIKGVADERLKTAIHAVETIIAF